jgi:hypothetical protein
MICVRDPKEVLLRYSLFLGRNAQNSQFHLDRGYVKIFTPEETKKTFAGLEIPDLPFIFGITIATDDLNRTREIVRSNGIVPVFNSTSIMWIGPKDALGCYMGFHEKTYVPI